MLLSELNKSFSLAQVEQLWEEFNKTCFDGELTKPEIAIDDDIHKHMHGEDDYFGAGEIEAACAMNKKTGKLILIFKSESNPIKMMQMVAHEMVHQSLVEKFDYDSMLKFDHGSEFSAYKDAIAKYHNTKLLDGNGVPY